jgi:hypothetical protein
LVHFRLAAIDAKAWLTPRRARVDDIATLTEYSHAGIRTGFAIGKSDIRLRVYDKTAELRLGRNEGNKRDEEHARWGAAGWDGRDDVVRVEYQLRGEVLKELDIREPERLLERLDPIWRYCAHKWCRLVDLRTSTRRERCLDDKRWSMVKTVSFQDPHAAPAARIRSRSLARARLAAGTALNYAARAGILDASALSDTRAHVARWSDDRAAAFVRNQFVRALRAAANELADELLRAHGAHNAAIYVIERLHASLARASSVSALVLAPEAPRRNGVSDVALEEARPDPLISRNTRETPAVSAPPDVSSDAGLSRKDTPLVDVAEASRATCPAAITPGVPEGVSTRCYGVRQ